MKKALLGLALLVIAAGAYAADTNTVFAWERPDQSGTLTISNLNLKGVISGSGTMNIGASLTGNIPEAALTNAAGSLGDNLGGNIPAIALTNAIVGTIQPAYASGKFSVVDTTQLVFIAGAITNVLDSDITAP